MDKIYKKEDFFMNQPRPAISFDEDNFDLHEHKKAAEVTIREKTREKRIRRQIAIGKTVLAIVAISIFFLLFYIITEIMPPF
jgi:hypothetical protein